MRPIDWTLIGDGNQSMLLLTAGEISESGPMFVADFKDTHALVFKKTKNWLGLTKGRGVRFGKKPIRLINGVWYVTEDSTAQSGNENVELRPELLSLEPIK